MRHVGFGDEQHAGGEHPQQVAQQLHDLVRFRQMDAGRADCLPQVGDGIEPDDLGAVVDVEQQDVQVFEQHIRIAEVHVELVVAEGGPDVALPGRGLHRAQQRRRARAGHGRQVRGGVHLDEIVPLRCQAVAVGAKPVALARDVVDDQIRHEPVVDRQGLHVVPAAERRVHGAVVDDGKAVVGAVREERQDVQAGHGIADARVEKAPERRERRLAVRANHVAVGDEHGVALIPAAAAGRWRTRVQAMAADAVAAHQQLQALQQPRQRLFAVEPREAAADALEHGALDHAHGPTPSGCGYC